MKLLHPARDAHRPPSVTEMALQLARDRRCCERRELKAAVRIEALDRLQQPDDRNLTQVVERFAAVGKAPREEFG